MAHPVVMAFLLISVHGILNKKVIETHSTSALSNRVKGFTLLELLVVIVIISILFTYATLAIRGSSPEELIQQEANRLDRLLQLALDEAVLRNTEYGIELSSRGYRFLYYEENKWRPMEQDKQLRERELPHEMLIELSIEQTDVVIDSSSIDDDKKLQPQVFLLSSEEITPEFSARFTIPGIAASYVVHGNVAGQHTVKASEL